MVRHALRRLLWTLPTLVGVSFVTFLFLSYVPDPADDPALRESLPAAEIEALRRERFLELPRFANLAPVDVRVRAAEVVATITDGGPEAEPAKLELVRLGGAALPHVLPLLDTLSPVRRVRLALALAPIARRMGISAPDEIDDPKRAVAFWTRFWVDRGVEFRTANVRSAVGRLVRYGSPLRAAELLELDTFALDGVMETLELPYDAAQLRRARALIAIAAHVTARDDTIAAAVELAAARACVERWRYFWSVYRSDFVVFAGASRPAAMLLETRYGKWALDAITHRGRRADGTSVARQLEGRAPVTLAIVVGAILLAYACAVPLGALAAARRGSLPDLGIAAVTLSLYAVPTVVIAVIALGVLGTEGGRVLSAMVTLAIGLVAAPTSQQRSALASELPRGYLTAAVARGASRARAVLVHGLRNALMPIATLAALEAPMALGGAFVVEHVFGVHGLGEVTIRAVRERDVAWLMAISIIAAFVAAVFVIVTDVVYTLLDPRIERSVIGRGGFR